MKWFLILQTRHSEKYWELSSYFKFDSIDSVYISAYTFYELFDIVIFI